MTRHSYLVAIFLATLSSTLIAETENQDNPPSNFTQEELESLLAPVALYPDSLLTQVLMAATYPLEVVEAARWSQDHPDSQGADAVNQVDDRNWDPSVKSLVAFPPLLSQMNEKLEWTEQLGDAFLGQRDQVMDEVQYLRDKAYDAGNLKSSDQVTVTRDEDDIRIEPAHTDVVYVPYYNSTVVYGDWSNPTPPVYWDPWPGYTTTTVVHSYDPANAFLWGVGITLAAGYLFGEFDWHHHEVNVVNVNNYYGGHHDHHGFHDGDDGHRDHDHPGGDHQVWQHDPSHRRGVPYHNAHLKEDFGRSRASGDHAHDEPAHAFNHGPDAIHEGNDDHHPAHGEHPAHTHAGQESHPHKEHQTEREISRPATHATPQRHERAAQAVPVVHQSHSEMRPRVETPVRHDEAPKVIERKAEPQHAAKEERHPPKHE